MANINNDLQLLCNALSSQGEAEEDGVKFIYMDDSTVYRFENNRMKKVSKAMLNKANKLLASQSSYPGQEQPTRQATKKTKQPTKQSKRTIKKVKDEDSEDEQDQDQDQDQELEQDQEPEPEIIKPAIKKTTRKPKQTSIQPSTIDLNEYWQVKSKNEYMNNEIERLNNKVNKLKHYKTIVNKLTGGEYDPVIPPDNYGQPISTTQVPAAPANSSKNNFSRSINDNLFMF